MLAADETLPVASLRLVRSWLTSDDEMIEFSAGGSAPIGPHGLSRIWQTNADAFVVAGALVVAGAFVVAGALVVAGAFVVTGALVVAGAFVVDDSGTALTTPGTQ